MAQEKNTGAEWLELAKAAAKAERELNVKAYAVICICKKVDGKEVVLHRYELRRESLQRWAWVINWRRAKCICEDPRANIYETYYHYDKTSGENYGFSSDLAQLVALKGRITLQEKLKDADLSFDVVPFVIEQIGNIINAEDMFDVWKDIGVKVTRIDRGTPKEIPLLAKTLENADGNVDKSVFEKIKKLLRSIA